MKKIFNSKLFLQVIVASMVATLATAGIVAATTIGTNISTGGTLAVTGASTLTGNTAVTGTLGVTGKTTLVNASTTLMTVAGKSWLDGNVTIAASKGLILGSSDTAITGSAGMIYYDTGSNVIKLNDGTSWFTVGTSTDGMTLSGNMLEPSDLSYYLTVGTTTQQGLSMLTLEATSTAAIPLSIVARSSQTANLFQIMDSGSTNLLTVSSGGNLAVDTNTLLVNASSNRVGIGTTTPFASLSINNIAGDNAFVIGSSTATWLKVDASGLLTVAKAATFSGALQAVTLTDGTASFNSGSLTAANNLAFATASSTGQVKVASLGIASTTPAAGFQLSVGTGASATSTISMGKFCMYAVQEDGVGVYLRLGANQPANQPLATSTIPCN